MAMQGLLLDSGDTVIGPRGGRWNPRYDFEERLALYWPDIPTDRLAEAVAAGERLMISYPGTAPYALYYREILDHLGVVSPSWSDEELLAALLPPLDPAEVVEVLPDTLEALDELRRRGVPVVVMSNAWAGLDKVYEQLGIGHYFAGFVISELLGCEKPDPRMYRTASDLLGLSAGDCLFVDDHLPHVEAALALGYDGCHLTRRRSGSGGVRTVRSLLEVVELF